MPKEISETNGLRVAIETFAASPRYNVLKRLRVGRLMPEECGSLGELADMTLETVVELGSERIAKLPYVTLMHEGALVQLLHSLSSDEDIILANSDESAVSEPEQLTGSVQLEIVLRERLRAVSVHPDYAKVRGRTLGEFWDSRWTAAPFEEALRIEQLVGMDLSVLFKKRSVNDKRIQSICHALERVLNALSPMATAAEVARVAARKHVNVSQPGVRSVTGSATWSMSDEVLEPAHMAIVEAFSQAATDMRYQEVTGLIQGVINCVTPRELVDITLALPLDEQLVVKLTNFVQNSLGQEQRTLIVALLQGPGARVAHISRMLVVTASEFGAALGLLAVVIARGLGAQPVSLGTSRCEGFWTLNPQLVVEFAKRASGRGKASSRQPSAVGTPTLDPILQEWISVQAGRARVGKKCPKASDKQRRRRRS